MSSKDKPQELGSTVLHVPHPEPRSGAVVSRDTVHAVRSLVEHVASIEKRLLSMTADRDYYKRAYNGLGAVVGQAIAEASSDAPKEEPLSDPENPPEVGG